MPSFDRPALPESEISPWVRRFAPLIAPAGRVLDVAAGHGRHTRWLLAQGFELVAADIDTSGLRDLAGTPGLEIVAADLETGDWPFAADHFDAILVTNYLHRPHFKWLPESLRPGGVLLFDTFAAGNEQFGRPRNPDFLLAPAELLGAFGDRLQVVAYECGRETHPRPAVRQRLCAAKTSNTQLLPARE